MIYLADTANIEEIKELIDYFPIEGVTTNPTILAHENLPLSTVIPRIIDCINDKMIHIQTISENAEDILIEAKRYRDYFNLKDNYYVKFLSPKKDIRL